MCNKNDKTKAACWIVVAGASILMIAIVEVLLGAGGIV